MSPPLTHSRLRFWLELGIAIAVSAVDVAARGYFRHQLNYEHAVFFPRFSEGMEAGGPHVVVLASAAFLLGCLGRTAFWLIGPAVAIFLPIWSLADAFAGGGGHNLLPFELTAEGILCLALIVPAALGRGARRLVGKRRGEDNGLRAGGRS
jgi:hypothetical protein